jgi:hypothetical protein
VAAVSFSWRSPFSLFGIVAFVAASMAVFGTDRRRVVGWLCLAACVFVALVLHIFLRASHVA